MNAKRKYNNKTVQLRKGIQSVHDITFRPNKAVHRNFTGLDTREKEIDLTGVFPEYSPKSPVGKVVDRSNNSGEPIFFAFKESLKANKATDRAELNPKLLSTRVYTMR